MQLGLFSKLLQASPSFSQKLLFASLLWQVQSLTIAEASAVSRADAAERVLESAMQVCGAHIYTHTQHTYTHTNTYAHTHVQGRREVVERLQAAEAPAAEQREKLQLVEEQLANARLQVTGSNRQ